MVVLTAAIAGGKKGRDHQSRAPAPSGNHDPTPCLSETSRAGVAAVVLFFLGKVHFPSCRSWGVSLAPCMWIALWFK